MLWRCALAQAALGTPGCDSTGCAGLHELRNIAVFWPSEIGESYIESYKQPGPLVRCHPRLSASIRAALCNMQLAGRLERPCKGSTVANLVGCSVSGTQGARNQTPHLSRVAQQHILL